MTGLTNFLFVFLGGGLGAVGRYAVSLALVPKEGTFPWHTFAVNVTGCLVIGLLASLLRAKHAEGGWATMLFVVGFLGGFTTFSSFGNEMVQLLNYHEYRLAFYYAVGSLVLGVAAAGLGWWIMYNAFGTPAD